jgi:SAM-dependent methyltransferase
MELEEYLRKMRDDWDDRARQNALHFIADGRTDWAEADFYASGDQTVAQHILTDMTNICQGKDPKQMRVLELGCGAGRVTRALAKVFGEVHAVDVSPEMVRRARSAMAGFPNGFIHQMDGAMLTVLGDQMFDFAYSCCVFHISSYEIIQSLVREIGQRLRLQKHYSSSRSRAAPASRRVWEKPGWACPSRWSKRSRWPKSAGLSCATTPA